jgi:hypothetical protein
MYVRRKGSDAMRVTSPWRAGSRDSFETLPVWHE